MSFPRGAGGGGGGTVGYRGRETCQWNAEVNWIMLFLRYIYFSVSNRIPI